MDLICPHCQQTIPVADQLAGQTTNCPRCGGPFTVPLLGPAPAPPPPPAPTPRPPTIEPAAAPAPAPASAAAAEPARPPAPAAAGDHHVTVPLAPEAVRWIAPACLVLQFVLLFFTWTGLFPGGTPALTQSAAGIAFGMLPSRAADLPPPPPAPKEGQEAPRTPFQYRTLPGAPLMLGYFLLLFAGFVVSLALAAAHFASPATKQQLPTWVPRLVAHRTMVIGGLTILAFLCLIFYVFPLHFPLEDRLAEQAADVWNDVNTHLAKRDPAALVRYPLVARTWAYTFSVLAALVGVLGALADLWLEKRGARPVPRVTADW